MLKYLSCLLCFCTAGFLSAQLSPNQLVSKMGRGINLGNVLSAPVEGNWSGAASETYFIDVAEAGFTNVRIPIDFFGSRTTGNTAIFEASANTSVQYTGSRSDYVINNVYLNRVEQVVNWGLAHGLVIILDVHGATLKSEFIYTFDDQKTEYTHPTSAKRIADKEKFYAIWEQLSARFKDHSDDLVFEIINEPYFHLSETDMNQINNEVVNIIRASGSNNSTRKIIVTGGTKSSYEAITTIDSTLLNNDNYLIGTFHYYRPFAFTNSSDYRYNTSSWGSESDLNNIDTEFEVVSNWAASFNPPVAVYLGEFGADNVYGYAYSTGDLRQVNGNTASDSYPEGTGYADGGPDPNSRSAYHGYIAEAAINRGFAFSAWDAGGSSNKSIHLRKDAQLVTYDIAHFGIQSFVPKLTSPSTVIEDDIWVEDIKNALLNGYTPIACSNNTVIKNSDYECGYTTHWSLAVIGNTAQAVYQDALFASRSGSHAAKVAVSQSANFNNVILQNETITVDQNMIGKTIVFKGYARGSTENQAFKMRVKHTTNGSVNYTTSSPLTLGLDYPQTPQSFSFTIPENTQNIKFQMLCGNATGDYYYDDFSADINVLDTATVSASSPQIFPNPTVDRLFIKNIEDINTLMLFNLQGQLINPTFINTNVLDVSMLKNGLYFIQIISANDKVYMIKFIKT